MVVVGAGHAGLAISACLSMRGIDHVVLERGEVANSWRTERWDSLRLLTPNWCSRLPGHGYRGPDPDGFMDMAQTVAFISDFAHAVSAPVLTGRRVISVSRHAPGYRVRTDLETWQSRAVVLASGACNLPNVPSHAADLPSGILSVDTAHYRRPDEPYSGSPAWRSPSRSCSISAGSTTIGFLRTAESEKRGMSRTS
ncbi:MAG: NAD(P)-binding domain-containing protein [Marinibacterium profundimaris]